MSYLSGILKLVLQHKCLAPVVFVAFAVSGVVICTGGVMTALDGEAIAPPSQRGQLSGMAGKNPLHRPQQLAMTIPFGDDKMCYGTVPLAVALRESDEKHLSSILIGQMIAPQCLALAQRSQINSCLDEDEETYLHLACRSGDRFLIWLLLQAGANSNVANRFGESPLDVVGPTSAELRGEITRLVEHSAGHVFDS